MGKCYERREDETPKAWEAFCLYRDAGISRTILKTAKALNKHFSALEKWSVKYSWIKRAREWDRDQDIAEQQGELEAIKDMRRRHTETALLMQQIANDELIKHAKLAKKKGIKLHPDIVLKLTKEGTSLERLSRGEAQEISQIEIKDTVDYSMLDADDLRELRRIKKKMADAAKKSEDK